MTPHCDPTVNLHDWYHVVRGDTLVDVWPVECPREAVTAFDPDFRTKLRELIIWRRDVL